MEKYLDEFKKKNIVVIGDLMLDKYISGKVDRISPEAPVPIVSVEKETYVPGGAANAANNVATLGGNIFLFGVLGNDNAKDIFLDVARSKSINTDGVIVAGDKQTIQKIRILGHNQQLLRIDYEERGYIESNIDEKLYSNMTNLERIDAIIVSDYAKGTITTKLIRRIIEYANKKNIFVIIDPKPKHKTFYKGCSLITPNKKEAEEMSSVNIETKQDLERAGRKLIDELDCDILITTGESGMSLFEKSKLPIHIPTVAKEVYDVSGAGDTVIATLSLALTSGASFKEAAILANHAAGIKVGKVGTAPVHLKELRENLLEAKERGLI